MISKLKEPLLVTRPSMPPFDDFVNELKNIWETRWLTNQGPLHIKFENKLKEYLNVNHITLFTNGHLALDSAIKVLELQGEVITTPFTFISTAHAIVMNGLMPIFCDIKLSDYTIDEDLIESLITDQTSAIVAVHVYGNPCAVHKINKLATKYKLKVIYDAAHAFGVEIDRKPIGDFGDLSMFSFHATKVFHTIEGGALVYQDNKYEKPLYLMKNFGIAGPEEINMIGYNAKMNEFQAAMGILNLIDLNSNITNRDGITAIYREKLNGIPGLELLSTQNKVKYNYSYLPVLINELKFGMTRDKLFDNLISYNIIARKYFYPLITETPAYKKYKNSYLPNAQYVADRILCLPIFADMTREQAMQVCAIIEHIYSKNLL